MHFFINVIVFDIVLKTVIGNVKKRLSINYSLICL